MLFKIFLIQLLILHLCFGLDLFCRNLKGKKVDWFVAYKLPDLPSTNKGTQFLYTDSKSSKWILSDLAITDPKSAIGKTFSQFWEVKKNSKIFYAIYNDDNPSLNKTDSYRAHMKGAMAFDDFTGFWISHSVPKFIDLNKRHYTYPDSGLKYGQTFFCGTFSVTALMEIGKHLEYAQPSISHSNIPKSFSILFPALFRAIQKKRLSEKSGDFTVSQIVETLAGIKLKLFSKNKKFDKDLYSNFLGKELKASFFVQSWLNGGGTDLASFCDVRNEKVYNLRSMKLDNGKYSFTSSKDHSKWAISVEANKKVVCIADINRQKSQHLRGGGAICIENLNLWNLFQSSIDTIECCGNFGKKIAKKCD
uniref:Deoxyribonuclease II n=1 Tax=Panagrolaimus superbus TaxID=310955 RepID=A0A914YNV4_9BILA